MPRGRRSRLLMGYYGHITEHRSVMTVLRVQRPVEPVVHATWRCPNPVCRQWTRPSRSADGTSCDLCATPRPAHLSAREAAAVAVGAPPMRDRVGAPEPLHPVMGRAA